MLTDLGGLIANDNGRMQRGRGGLRRVKEDGRGWRMEMDGGGLERVVVV